MTTGTSIARVWTLNPSIDNAVKGGHMFNATDYLLLLPRKVIRFSLVAHKDSVSTMTANTFAY